MAPKPKPSVAWPTVAVAVAFIIAIAGILISPGSENLDPSVRAGLAGSLGAIGIAVAAAMRQALDRSSK